MAAGVLAGHCRLCPWEYCTRRLSDAQALAVLSCRAGLFLDDILQRGDAGHNGPEHEDAFAIGDDAVSLGLDYVKFLGAVALAPVVYVRVPQPEALRRYRLQHAQVNHRAGRVQHDLFADQFLQGPLASRCDDAPQEIRLYSRAAQERASTKDRAMVACEKAGGGRPLFRLGGAAVLVGLVLQAAGGFGPDCKAEGFGPATRPAGATMPASRPSDGDFRSQYEAKLRRLAPDDAAGLYRLAVWCAGRGRFDLAGQLCEKVLQIKPAHLRAKRLLEVARRRLVLASMAAGRAACSRPVNGLQEVRLLSMEAVYRIRFWEFRPDDPLDRPRVWLDRKYVRQFAEQQLTQGAMTPAEYRQFLRARNVDKLREIIAWEGAKCLKHVRIESDPRVFVIFKRKVFPIIAKGCIPAASRPFGSAHLRLLPYLASSVRGLYTNFYLLDGYRDENGLMIDRDQPERSLLLRYGLPTVEGGLANRVFVRPLFRDRADPRYRTVLGWIRMLRAPRPDYGIDESMFRPLVQPVPRPRTRPAGSTGGGSGRALEASGGPRQSRGSQPDRGRR